MNIQDARYCVRYMKRWLREGGCVVKRVMALIPVAALATTIGIFVSPVSAGSLARTSTIATFQDSVGEVAGGPDIGAVTVSLDGAVLTVEGKVAGMPEVMSMGQCCSRSTPTATRQQARPSERTISSSWT